MGRGAKKQSGFGLVEVLVCIAIFMVISVAVFDLYITTFNNWDSAKSRTIAYNILQETIESYRNLRDTNVVSGVAADGITPISWDAGLVATTAPIETTKTFDNRVYTTKVDISNLSFTANGVTTDKVRKKVTITVSWTGKSGDRQIQGITYLNDWKPQF